MKQRWILSLCVALVTFGAAAQSGSYQEERAFFEKTCMRCHEIKYYLWPRSYKSWELTAENMRRYVNDDSVLNSEDCRRIAEFLAAYAGEGKINVPDGVDYAEAADVVEEPPVSSVTETLPVAAIRSAMEVPATPEPVSSAAPEPVKPDVIEKRVSEPVSESVSVGRKSVVRHFEVMPLKRVWNPGRNSLKMARVSGFVAVICLVGLLVSGFGRRKLRLNFRKLHVKLALGLFLALAVHGVIYLFEYGTPDVLWYWFGFVGLILLVVTEVQGIVRKRFRKGLLISHIAGACAGLALSILHWIWAWL